MVVVQIAPEFNGSEIPTNIWNNNLWFYYEHKSLFITNEDIGI